MHNEEILSAITAAKKAGSFKLKLVFALGSEINGVRSFVTMLKGGGIAVDDSVMMKLRLVAISRKWQEDIDRVVVMAIEDDFDEREFVAKLRLAIESIEILPINFPLAGTMDGDMDVKKAIRRAEVKNLREVKIVIKNANRVDVALIMDMFRNEYISFTNPDEQKVFEEVIQNPNWSLGGRLSANIRIEKSCREHVASAVLHGAHVKARAIKVMR
jgi:hypothetical protein